MRVLSPLLAVAGFGMVVAGVACLNVAAALIVAGAVVAAAALFVDVEQLRG